MSERKHPAVNRQHGLGHSPVHALVHAGEVAQWTVVLLGWLWLAVEYLGPNLMGYVTAALPPGDLKTHLIDSAQHMRLVTLGIVLLLVLRFAPRGLIPEK
jgi:ABC-type branched-subunit amino acid transport system permease subunit